MASQAQAKRTHFGWREGHSGSIGPGRRVCASRCFLFAPSSAAGLRIVDQGRPRAMCLLVVAASKRRPPTRPAQPAADEAAAARELARPTARAQRSKSLSCEPDAAPPSRQRLPSVLFGLDAYVSPREAGESPCRRRERGGALAGRPRRQAAAAAPSSSSMHHHPHAGGRAALRRRSVDLPRAPRAREAQGSARCRGASRCCVLPS
jgi:hypothetical protein